MRKNDKQIEKVADKEEMLLVLNEDGSETDTFEKRSIVHDKLLYHREVVLWVINKKERKILFQRRAQDKRAWPDKFGLIAGHVVGNESLEEAVINEAKEEVGLNIKKLGYRHFFTFKKHEPNNYCYVYHYYTLANIPLDKYKIQEEELTELRYVDYDEYKAAVHGRRHDFVFKWNELYDQMFYILDDIFDN